MATHPMRRRPVAVTPHWYGGSSMCNRTYLLAAVRAGLIALVLLTFLVGLILL